MSSDPNLSADAQTLVRLRASNALLERTISLAGVGGWAVDLATQEVTWTAETCRIHDVAEGFQPTLELAIGFYAPDAQPVIRAAVENGMASGEPWDLELQLITATGRDIWVRAVGEVEFGDDGKPSRLFGAIQDKTSRKRAMAAVEASDRRYRRLFEYSPGLICTHDHEGVVLSVNPAAAQSLGYSINDAIGRSLTSFMRPERHQAFRDYLLRIITNDSDSGILELVAKDGSLRAWQYHNVLDDEGDEPYILGHAQDVTERHEHERRLREWSLRDSLTGCFNRRYLTEQAPQILAQKWGCIAIDLDHFKQVNDTYGHEAGDEVLVDMAEFLTDRVRPNDAVIRLGGDEFLLLLRDSDEAATDSVVGRIEQHRADAPIRFTLGVATLQRGVALEVGIAQADMRLYQVRAGRAGNVRQSGS